MIFRRVFDRRTGRAVVSVDYDFEGPTPRAPKAHLGTVLIKPVTPPAPPQLCAKRKAVVLLNENVATSHGPVAVPLPFGPAFGLDGR